MKPLEEIFAKFPILNVNEEFYLRQFQLSDAQNYFELYSFKEIQQYLPNSMIPQSIEDSESDIKLMVQSFTHKQEIYWGIVEKKTERLIGGCGFHNWNKFNRNNEIAYDLHPDYWRKGLMLACLKEIIKYAFLELGIYRVQATTLKSNEPSNKLLLKFGFTLEGTLRRFKVFKNDVIDVEMFSYTIEDFNKDVITGKFTR